MHATILKMLRQYHALTKYEMASVLGVSYGTIADIESVKRRPVSMRVLERAAEAFDMRMSSIIALSEAIESGSQRCTEGMCAKGTRMFVWGLEIGFRRVEDSQQ